MAALTDRDVNVQPTYNLAADEKQSSAGEDSKMDGPQQSKGALNHIAHNNRYESVSYVQRCIVNLTTSKVNLDNPTSVLRMRF